VTAAASPGVAQPPPSRQRCPQSSPAAHIRPSKLPARARRVLLNIQPTQSKRTWRWVPESTARSARSRSGGLEGTLPNACVGGTAPAPELEATLARDREACKPSGELLLLDAWKLPASSITTHVNPPVAHEVLSQPIDPGGTWASSTSQERLCGATISGHGVVHRLPQPQHRSQPSHRATVPGHCGRVRPGPPRGALTCR
jgi:hypothetical protein